MTLYATFEEQYLPRIITFLKDKYERFILSRENYYMKHMKNFDELDIPADEWAALVTVYYKIKSGEIRVAGLFDKVSGHDNINALAFPPLCPVDDPSGVYCIRGQMARILGHWPAENKRYDSLFLPRLRFSPDGLLARHYLRAISTFLATGEARWVDHPYSFRDIFFLY